MKVKTTDTEWVELRDKAVRAVLENDDLSLFEKFIKRYCPEVKKNLIKWNNNDTERIKKVMRLMAYKMIPEITTFTAEERNKAREWLREHNSKPLSWE
ncbi:MAG: hypothetical protein IIW48_10660 [Clostridia bacterium]|nr:hypothetical protein [Clostridia bacterium]